MNTANLNSTAHSPVGRTIVRPPRARLKRPWRPPMGRIANAGERLPAASSSATGSMARLSWKLPPRPWITGLRDGASAGRHPRRRRRPCAPGGGAAASRPTGGSSWWTADPAGRAGYRDDRPTCASRRRDARALINRGWTPAADRPRPQRSTRSRRSIAWHRHPPGQRFFTLGPRADHQHLGSRSGGDLDLARFRGPSPVAAAAGGDPARPCLATAGFGREWPTRRAPGTAPVYALQWCLALPPPPVLICGWPWAGGAADVPLPLLC